MQWFSTKRVEPDEDSLYVVCLYNDIFKKSMPADKFAVIRNGIWYWYDNGYWENKIEGKVTHFMQLEFPQSDF